MKRTISFLAAALAVLTITTIIPASANTTNDGRFIYPGEAAAPMGQRQYTGHQRHSRVASHRSKPSRTAHRPITAKQTHREASVGQPPKAKPDRRVAPQQKQDERTADSWMGDAPDMPFDSGVRHCSRPGDREAGAVRSCKTGAVTHVASANQPKFQAYIDDVEAFGGAVYYMGGYRGGKCSLGSQHPCGGAIDVCQDSRGHVSGERDCHLPAPFILAILARKNNLWEGSIWCNTDYGHVQARKSGDNCVHNPTGWAGGVYLATITGKVKVATVERAARRKVSHRYARRHARVRTAAVHYAPVQYFYAASQ